MPFIVQINTRETETLNNPLQTVDFFTNIDISLKYDAVASDFQFDYLFDSNSQDSLEVAGITHFHEVVVSYQYKDGSIKKVLTGFVSNQNFIDSPKPQLLSIGGRSKPGLLEKSDIPISVPLQSDGLQLSKIIQNICSVFNLKLVIDNNAAYGVVKNTVESSKLEFERADEIIEKSTSSTSENAASYLKKLCLQKNIVLTHNANGNLVVKTANTESDPVLIIDADENPFFGYTQMSLNCSGEDLYRFVTVVRQADDLNGNESNTTLKNPFSPVVAVPSWRVEIQTQGDDITVTEACANALQKTLKAIVLTIELVAETASAELILPDNTIFIKNKKLNLFKMTKFFIEKVDIKQDPKKTTQTLTCVLPWVYNYNSVGAGKTIPGPFNVFIEPRQNFPIA